jgi:hypothetical protein
VAQPHGERLDAFRGERDLMPVVRCAHQNVGLRYVPRAKRMAELMYQHGGLFVQFQVAIELVALALGQPVEHPVDRVVLLGIFDSP